MIHLDTNVLIRGLPKELNSDRDTPTQISSLVYAEFLDGLNSQDPAVVVDTQLKKIAIDLLYGGGIPFDGESARLYQSLSSVSLRSGRTSKRRRLDLMIAATAVRNQATLATYNPGDFSSLEGALNVLDLSE